MTNKHMKRCLTALTIREMQIKNIMKYYLTPIRMVIYQKKNYWQRCKEIGTLVHCWLECKMVQLLCKTVWQFLKKSNIELPYDLAILLLSMHPEELKQDV